MNYSQAKESTVLSKHLNGIMTMKNENVYVILDHWMHIIATFVDNKKALAYREVLMRESPDSYFTVEEHPVIC